MSEQQFTKYEAARLIGSRALQLAMGAPPLIDFDKLKLTGKYVSLVDLAKMEFQQSCIPMQVVKKSVL